MKQSKGKKFLEALPLILSFVIPVLGMLVILLQRKVYPFGDRSFLRTDLYHQYCPFLNEMADKLQTGESLLYSWDIGAGTNFVSLYAYYLASPLNWLLAFIPHEHVIEYLTYAMVAKLGLSSLTMAIYLKSHYKKNSLALPLVAMFYGMSGYLAAYSWNVMWLDCVWLFPLIMLGLERLFKENKPFLYCITLALSIMSNYYISIMICMFIVLYSVALIFLIPSHEKVSKLGKDGQVRSRIRFTNYFRKFGMIVIYSLLAGGIAAVTLLPEIYALKLTASANSTFPSKVTVYFTIFEALTRHLMDVDVHLKLAHWPNIYCGVGIFIAVPLYIMNKNTNYKEKFVNLILCGFRVISFCVNVLSYIWHGMHYPNSLPARQSFIYIFLMLSMAYQGLLGLKDRTSKQIVGSAAFGIGFVVLTEILNKNTDEFNWTSYYFSALFIAVYALLCYMYRKRKVFIPLIIAVALTLTTFEAAINTSATSITTIDRNTYMDYDKGAKELVSAAKAVDGVQFARFEKNELRTKNDGAWLDYPSLSTFSSMSYHGLTDFYRTMGMESSTNAYSSTGMTPVTSALFDVKYVLSNAPISTGSIYKEFGNKDGIYLYENPYALPLMYVLPSDIEDEWSHNGGPIKAQNSFIKKTTGISDVFVEVPMTTEGSTQTATIAVPGLYYAYSTGSAKEIKVTSGDYTKTHKNLDRKYIMPVPNCEAGTTVTFATADSTNSISVHLYRLDEALYKEAMNKLKTQSIVMEEFSDTYLRGTLTAAEDGLVFTSVANDPGWTVMVDGKTVTAHGFSDDDGFLCFNIGAGTHTIEMSYEPQGLRLGLMVSGGSVLLLLLLALLHILLARRAPAIEGVDLGPRYGLFSDYPQEYSAEEFYRRQILGEELPDYDDEDDDETAPLSDPGYTPEEEEAVAEEYIAEEGVEDEDIFEEQEIEEDPVPEENASDENASEENASEENASEEAEPSDEEVRAEVQEPEEDEAADDSKDAADTSEGASEDPKKK